MRNAPETYAATIICADRMRLFQRTDNAELLIATLFRYRDEGRLLLHGFVIMPDHTHLLLSPAASLEGTVGVIKGGYSFAVRQRYKGPVWQKSYYSHRIRDTLDFESQMQYMVNNPVRRGYEAYPHVHGRYSGKLDPMPAHLGG